MTAKQWAEKLVDYVSGVTQLDPDKDELANVEDWRRNAEVLFMMAIREARAAECETIAALPWDRGMTGGYHRPDLRARADKIRKGEQEE